MPISFEKGLFNSSKKNVKESEKDNIKAEISKKLEDAEIESLDSDFVSYILENDYPLESLPLNKFKDGSMGVDIAEKLIDVNRGKDVAIYISLFKKSDHPYLADKIIEDADGTYVAQLLHRFVGVNHQKIADKLIDNGLGVAVKVYYKNFVDLNEETLDILRRGLPFQRQ